MDENLKYWLAINTIPKIGPVTIKKLYDHFGSIEKAWRAEEKEIRMIEGIHLPAIKSFIENRSKINPDDEYEKLKRSAAYAVSLEESEYPFLLKNIYDPPPVIYYKGELPINETRTIGIVGTRRASRYGLETARKMAQSLVENGFTIISGLAAGIDTAAHQAALEAGGKTVAVFGCGVDVIFPAENRELAKKIETSGSLVSEFPLGAAPDKGSFPRRNRVISGLSLGVIVVEGHYDSGAMITAKYALDQGREVFAVPGNVEAEQSKGPHWLIKQGAKLVEGVEDVLDELKLQIPNHKSQTNIKSQIITAKRDYSGLSLDEQKIAGVLAVEPKYIDNISIETGLPIAQVSGLLAVLEMKNMVKQLPGKMFYLA